jgi:hypothetical protein
VSELLSEGLDFGPLLGELSLKLVDPGFGRDAVHGVDDPLGLAVERLSRLITVAGHLGDIAVPAAEDRESAGDALRDRGHGDSFREDDRGINPRLHTPRRELSTD